VAAEPRGLVKVIALLLAASTAVQRPDPEIAPLVPLYTLSLSQGEWRVKVNLKPGEPSPQKLLELVFDVEKQDAPLRAGKLQLTVSGPGQTQRYLVHALGDAGTYGVHWTPDARGVWTLGLAPYEGAGPDLAFQVGVGEPMPASAQGHLVQSSRSVVGATAAAEPTLTQLMRELGRRWRSEFELQQPDAAELKAMAKLMRAVAGKVPREFAGDTQQFDELAARLAVQLDQGKLPDARACLECHVKFRDSWEARQ
jgi:hypothetical protein